MEWGLSQGDSSAAAPAPNGRFDYSSSPSQSA